MTRHGPVRTLAEAAAARGVEPRDIVKTLVVRRAEDDFLFVLVPGDREFSWPKLRALLGTNRLSMPDAAVARRSPGYERGTITPFGSTTAWPVVADATMAGRTVSLGAGAHGVASTVAATTWSASSAPRSRTSPTPRHQRLTAALAHRDADAPLLRTCVGEVVPRVDVPDDAHRRGRW